MAPAAAVTSRPAGIIRQDGSDVPSGVQACVCVCVCRGRDAKGSAGAKASRRGEVRTGRR